MPTALDVIKRGLRLINVPGRGALLSAIDTQNAFEALQDLINTHSVSECFIPGVNRHFFALNPNQDIYSYGPGGQLDTTPFGDLTPVRIEDAYIREGATLVDNEKVTNGDFDTATDWTLGANWSIVNGVLRIAPGGTGVASQGLSLAAGVTYNVKVTVTQRASSVSMRILQDATPVITQVLDSNGTFTFVFTITGGSTWTIDFTANSTSDLDIDDVSVLERNKSRIEITTGSDYRLTLVDQFEYNQRFTKGTGGRPYEIYFTRNYDVGELRFDNSAIAGDLLVTDVLVNKLALASVNDEIRMHPDGLQYLKYRLAYEIAPEYGKAVSAQHQQAMRRAYNAMTSGNDRMNHLRADRALQQRPTFDINRGDP